MDRNKDRRRHFHLWPISVWPDTIHYKSLTQFPLLLLSSSWYYFPFRSVPGCGFQAAKLLQITQFSGRKSVPHAWHGDCLLYRTRDIGQWTVDSAVAASTFPPFAIKLADAAD